MTLSAKPGLGALTEREKQTLRMIVRGHDAKSIARTLGLSVHTINERLREARRKVAVSSSREAARLLFEAEDSIAARDPDLQGDTEIGDATPSPAVEEDPASMADAGRHRLWLLTGVALMVPVLALLGFAALAPLDPVPTAPVASAETPNPAAVEYPAAVDAAQHFLTMIDQARWDASYAAAGASFRKVNTVKLWADTSEKVRAPLGAMVARTLLSAETDPAPPRGFQLIKFRTQFTNKTVVETVTLDREHGDWRVSVRSVSRGRRCTFPKRRRTARTPRATGTTPLPASATMAIPLRLSRRTSTSFRSTRAAASRFRFSRIRSAWQPRR